MAESNSKRQKSAKKEDRISSLPDCLLSHILSFLPTKTSIQTSILARRWRHIWKDLTVLDFSDKSFESNKTFAVFVNNVFSLRSLRKPYPIKKMRLSCTKLLVQNEFCIDSVDTWIRTVTGPHLKELDLLLDVDDNEVSVEYDLPITLLSGCTNLVSLSLHSDIFIESQLAKDFHLPSLKKLKVCAMSMPQMNEFLDGCPILETLDTYFFYGNYTDFLVGDLRVPPTLKRLKINFDTGSVAPRIYYLSLTQIRFGDVGNLQNVVRASLDVFPSSGYHSFLFTCLLKLLNALSGIKHLVLGCSTTKWLLRGPADLPFPEFYHLLHLELILPWFNSNFLLSLLQTCHHLQVLIIQNDKEKSHLAGWATQPSVPNCIVSHLTFIQFKGYQGLPDELLFAEYILQKGLVLKTMIIDDISVDLTNKFNILNKLSKVRRDGTGKLLFD